MKKLLVFSIISFISIFSFNMRSKALNTTCADYVEGSGKYYFIWNEKEIEINSELLGSVKWTDFTTKMSLIDNISWYVFENSYTGEVMLLLTDYGVYGLDSYTYAIRYVQTSQLNKHFFKFIFNNGVLTSSSIYTNTSYIIEDYGSNRRGRIINTSSGSFNVKTPSNVSQSIKIEESATCSYIPSTINAPTFEANYTQYNDQNIAVNLTINFKDFDLEKYDYFLSFDEGKSYKNINTNIDSEGNYILTRLENFNVTAKIVDKSNNNSIFASYYEDNLTTLDNFIVFYEDSTKNEYVTVDNKEYLYSKTTRMYPITQVENLQYRYTTDNEVYQYFSDVIEKKSFRNENINVEVVDKYYNVIKTFSYSVTGFESSAELGETIIFDEFIDSEDKEKIIVYLRILNANSSHNYYVKQENSSYKKVFPLNWESGKYYFDSTDTITNYCARITNEKNEVIKEECYTIKGFSTTKNFHSFMIKIKRFINNQKDTINSLSNAVDDFFLMIPDPIFNLLTFLYFLLCLGAIIWNVRR